MKHPAGKPFLLLLMAAGTLLLLQWADLKNVGNIELKPVSLFSDIIHDNHADKVNRMLAKIDIPEAKRKQIPKDSVPEGMVPIEDYADSANWGMRHFFRALHQRDRLNRPVRIAYFGDSFIEGDILTADLRALLQSEYGGAGIGYVDVHPPFADCRISMAQLSSGWDVRNILMKDSCERHRLGISQRYATPLEGAFTEVRNSKRFAHLDSSEVALCYVQSRCPMTIRVRVNGGDATQLQTKGKSGIEVLTTQGNLKRVRWNFPADPSATCYGVALEGLHGICLDNFSFRGTSGTTLGNVPQRQWNRWAAARPYDLIVLHFGLNVATKDVVDYEYYLHSMRKVIAKMKTAYPQTSFLIVSVSDREDKIDGQLRTLPGVKALVKYQQKLAAEEHIAYWNLYDAMGGEGSIVRMANEKPHGARMDYTHITSHGGQQIARIFYETLNYGYRIFRKYMTAEDEVLICDPTPVIDESLAEEDYEMPTCHMTVKNSTTAKTDSVAAINQMEKDSTANDKEDHHADTTRLQQPSPAKSEADSCNSVTY